VSKNVNTLLEPKIVNYLRKNLLVKDAFNPKNERKPWPKRRCSGQNTKIRRKTKQNKEEFKTYWHVRARKRNKRQLMPQFLA